MADEPNGGEGAPSTIKVGEVEYTPEQLQGLIDDGLFKREIETKQNTKLDRVMPEYTRLTQEKKGWVEKEAELERFKAEKSKPKEDEPVLDEATLNKARTELKKLGVFTKDDVESYFKENFTKAYTIQRDTDRFFDVAHKLESEIDGKDGRPKFVLDDVLEHMKETGIRDPLKAYKDKNEMALDKWKDEQLSRNRRDGIVSERSSNAGGKTPPAVRPTRANLKDLFREALYERNE